MQEWNPALEAFDYEQAVKNAFENSQKGLTEFFLVFLVGLAAIAVA